MRDVKREGKPPGASASGGDPSLVGGEGDFQRHITDERTFAGKEPSEGAGTPTSLCGTGARTAGRVERGSVGAR